MCDGAYTYMIVAPRARDRVPPSNRTNYGSVHVISGGTSVCRIARTFRTAVTTDMSLRETLAWAATVVVCSVCEMVSATGTRP